MDDFAPIEQLAGNLLRGLVPSERRSLLRKLARTIRASQSDRIGRQQNPDGSPFAARRPKSEQRPGAYAVRFLYPKGAANPRQVFMKSWVMQGPLLTGFDIEAGGLRSFFRDKIAEWLPVPPGEQNAGAGRLRRRGQIKRTVMFRKLGRPGLLESGASDAEAWIGFTGRAAIVARVHQEGLSEEVRKGLKVRYARRELLGLTDRERNLALDVLIDHVASRALVE